LAERLGVLHRCRFVKAPADDLSPVADGTVDVVTTRSVLAYVGPKREAFAEFARVLRPGGRISLYEPINRLICSEPSHLFSGYDVSPVEELATRVGAAYERRQSPIDDPMFNFDERDLLAFADRAGFSERHLELHVDMARSAPLEWDAYANTSPNPRAPTLREAMAESLSSEEEQRFTAHLRPLVERGDGTSAVAIAYLWATKG
jgi:arsenite methyltransferase